MKFVLIVTIAWCFTIARALNNGLGLKPQMGWNSWNKFACNINEDLIKKTADAMVATGLRDLGYEYVNLDDCWQVARDPATKEILADPKAFPSGMKALGDYIHSKGLKFGVYSDAGSKTCQGRPGSLNYEKVDASMYASWGVDYLKYDNCFDEGISPKIRFPPMRDALNATGRPIFYSMCEWGIQNPAAWAADVANSWRTTMDISDNWASMLTNWNLNERSWKAAGPGHWNDPDMLEVGNGGMSKNQYIAHMSLWSIGKAPLIIGCDVTNMTQDTFEILSNKEVIAVNQDALGVQGHRVRRQLNLGEVYAGPLVDGMAVVLFNPSPLFSLGITAHWNDLGLPARTPMAIRDLWAHRDVGIFQDKFSVTVPAASAVMIKLTKAN